MISVDTSVWIELLRGRRSPESLVLRRLISEDEGILLSPIVLMEILLGIKDERHLSETEGLLLEFAALELDVPGDFLMAASLYRKARAAGFTIRSAIDCLIAASCVRTGTPLLHKDADFDRLAACTPLRVHQV